MINKVVSGIKRHPKRFFIAFIVGVSELWAFVHPMWEILDIKVENHNFLFLLGYILVSLVIASILVWPKRAVKFKLINTNTKVEIAFGDIFSTTGLIAIPVNEYYDSELGKPVSPKSLHGKFINQILGG